MIVIIVYVYTRDGVMGEFPGTAKLVMDGVL